MSIDYIRRTYGVDFKIGQAVRIRPGAGSLNDGRTGKLVRARGQYLVVRGRGWGGDYHPADILPAASATQDYQGVRCMCVQTGCRAGPGCPHYCSHCRAHIAHVAKAPTGTSQENQHG